MAGEPLLLPPSGALFADRQSEGERLFADLCANREDSLRIATGVFCGAFYQPAEDRLALFSDKLGVRPIYYAVLPDVFVFASALRILLALRLVRGIDVRGTYETCAFGFPLGDRSCYENTRTINAGELVSLSGPSVTARAYYRWDRLPADAGFDEQQAIPMLSEGFASAVSRRLRGDRTVVSFLSGGLDSRTIAATLRAQSVRVVTVNFAPPRSQDRRFAVEASQVLGTTYHQLEVPYSEVASAYRHQQLGPFIDQLAATSLCPDRPGLVWSGDGGSTGVGHVHLDEDTVHMFDHGRIEEGVRSYLRYNRLFGAANAALADGFRRTCKDWHVEGVKGEIERLPERQDARALHLFLMLNHQRRHLVRHFEDIDLTRLELQTPFFDSPFLESIVRAPVTPFLRHRLYLRWLSAFAPTALSVPWQAYPGHEPCPIKIKGEDELLYQWSGRPYFGRDEERRATRRRGHAAFTRLLRSGFPGHLLHRGRLAAGVVTALLGMKALGHIVHTGDTFLRCWKNAE